MSAHLPPRRIASIAPSTLSSVAAPATFRRALLPLSQRRSKWGFSNWFKRSGAGGDSSHSTTGGRNLDNPSERRRVLAEQQQRLTPSLTDSIFEDEVQQATKDGADKKEAAQPSVTFAETAVYRTDPDPRSRLRWERKKVIQMIRSQTAGKEASDWMKRTDRIARTEHQLMHKSPLLETSTKKLMMLARQIQGKPLDEALQQMSYSKKKMATEVKFQLEEARDLAVVSRGMGLGKAASRTAVAAGSVDKTANLVKIKTKDGQTLKISDPTNLYVAEAWVGRGTPRGKEIDYKGRGRRGIIVKPSTSISVVLKEEKTRIRQHNERAAKEAKRKPWVHLPNRPITAQRPYYSW